MRTIYHNLLDKLPAAPTKVDCNRGYEGCLRVAGVEVVDSLHSGDWQGTWFAVIKLPEDDKKFVVEGAYGSCSVCDHYLAVFDYWPDEDISPELDAQKRMDVGRSYLDSVMSLEDFKKKWKEIDAENSFYYYDDEAIKKWVETL